MDKIEFLLDSDNKSVQNIISKALNEKNIAVTRKANKNKNLITINIRNKASYQNIYGSNIANLQIKIKLISSNNKVIASNIIEVSGASVTNNQDALSAAVKKS